MKARRTPSKILTAFVLLAVASVCYAKVRTKVDWFKHAPRDLGAHANPLCMTAAEPGEPFKFTILAKISAEKTSYGAVEEVLVAIADQARVLGADAVIRLRAKQQF